MNETSNAGVRLAYWRDQFTILKTRKVSNHSFQTEIWQVLLYRHGRRVTAVLPGWSVPDRWQPRVGDRIHAELRIADPPKNYRLFLQSITVL